VNTEAEGIDEEMADYEDLISAVANSKVHDLAIALYLFVVMICKCSINPNTNPNTVYSHLNA
jgi:hypothetical protein